MRVIAGQRNFHDIGAARFRVFEDRFECRIGDDEFALRRTGECLGAKFQDLARAVAEHDLIAVDVVDLRDLVDQDVVRFVRITITHAVRVLHRFMRFRGRSVGIFVRAKPHHTGLGGRGNCRRFLAIVIRGRTIAAAAPIPSK